MSYYDYRLIHTMRYYSTYNQTFHLEDKVSKKASK